MQLIVMHRTTYRFSRPLISATQLLRLTPSIFLSQTLLDSRIDVNCNAQLRESRDGYGNGVHMLYIDEPVQELAITATARVITEDRAGLVEGLPGDLPPEVFLRPTPLTEPDQSIRQLADNIAAPAKNPLELLHALNSTLHERMTFDQSITGTGTSAAQSFQAGSGVCQDFAHIFIAAARARQIPTRYVSGHLFRRDGASIQEAGHAWAEAWVPELGWVAFDPANGICADDAYVRVAAGLDYLEAAPLAGTRRGGGTEELSVEVAVTLPPPRSQRQTQRQSQGRGGSAGQSQSQSQIKGDG